MSYLLEDKQYHYTFALCRSCRTDGAMTFGVEPSIERFLDRLVGQNNNAEVLKRIYADHTHNLGVSWLDARPALAQMIEQGQLSVVRRPRPKPKKKRWARDDWDPPAREDGSLDNTRYDSRGYPLCLDGWGDWRIDHTKPVKRGSDADGSRPLDPHPHEVWQKVANPDGTLKPEAMRADGFQPQKRITVVYQYASGMPVAGALCSIYDQNNRLVGGGPIIAAPQTIFQLPNHVNWLTVELHDDPLIQAYLRQPFPNPEIPKAQPGWFDRMSAALSSAGDWAAGVIAGDFNEDPTLSQIITNTAITLIPLVDQAADLRDIAASLRHLLWVENGYLDYLAWAGLGLTVIGLFPTVGSLVKGVLKAVFFKLPLDRLFKAFNSLAEGHAGRYLKQLQNGGLKELCSQSIKKTRQILNAIYENLHRLKDQAPDFLVNIKNKISAILRALDECANRLNAMFSRFFDELAEKLKRAMRGKTDLAFEGVPNSTVTYKQVKQEPPVFKVEDGVEKEYAGNVGDVEPKKILFKKFDDLKAQGHGPQRHEGDVTTKQLEERCMKGIDPMTGTTTDGVTSKTHKYSRNATKVNTPEDYVKAEEYLKNSNEYKDKVKYADAIGKKQVVLEETKLKDIYGDSYSSKVDGRTRIGSAKNPQGSNVTEFSDESKMIGVYRKADDGTWNLLTMYPDP